MTEKKMHTWLLTTDGGRVIEYFIEGQYYLIELYTDSQIVFVKRENPESVVKSMNVKELFELVLSGSGGEK